MAGEEQMVGYDAAVTAPPDRFGAHHRDVAGATEVDEIGERSGEVL